MSSRAHVSRLLDEVLDHLHPSGHPLARASDSATFTFTEPQPTPARPEPPAACASDATGGPRRAAQAGPMRASAVADVRGRGERARPASREGHRRARRRLPLNGAQVWYDAFTARDGTWSADGRRCSMRGGGPTSASTACSRHLHSPGRGGRDVRGVARLVKQAYGAERLADPPPAATTTSSPTTPARLRHHPRAAPRVHAWVREHRPCARRPRVVR